MIWIERPQTNPWFNIAAEEYILKQYPEDVLMFWQNISSVVVGKHQNTAAEVDLDFTETNHIPVIRRISGGGTVYHDMGNLNYTLIRSTKENNYPVDFKAFTKPLIEFLKTYGLNPRFEGKNNLLIGNKKFSGNAAHVFKNRVMHHGSLLFDTNLEILEKVIQPRQNQFTDKAIKSIRAEVANLCDELPENIKQENFKQQFKRFLIEYYNIKKIHQLTHKDIDAINKLAETKYKSWEWNIGYSPRFSVQNKINTSHGLIQVNLRVKAGIIEQAEIYVDEKKQSKIEEHLLHQRYCKNELLKKFSGGHFSDTLVNALF